MSAQRDIRLIVLDLDGTALDYDEQHHWLSEALVGVLNELGERGVQWCTNSGRHHLNQLGLVQACRDLDNMPQALLSGERFIHWLTPGYHAHEPFNGRMQERMADLHPQVLDALAPHRERLRSTYAFNHEMELDYVVGWNVSAVDRATAFAAELADLLADVPDAQVLRNLTWVIVTHAQAGKGVLIEEIGRYLAVPRAQILAIGDHLNDLDMLDGRAAGHVGCPADADNEVKQVVAAAGGIISDLPHVLGTTEIIRDLTGLQ